MDRIFFLGTGGTAGVTARQLRGTGGFVLFIDDLQLIIDPGPGALVALHQHGINPRATTAVLCSHAHLNHTHDLNALATAISLNKMDTQGILIPTESVLAEGLISEHHQECFEKIILAQPYKEIGLENIEIMPIPAFHDDPLSVGFRITTPSFVIAYSGDTKFKKELAHHYEGADILIVNVVDPYNKKGDQLSTHDVERLIRVAKPKLVILTHFGADMLKANPLYEARELRKRTGITIIAAEDGMSIDPISYNATLTQNTLTMYPSQDAQ